MQLYAEVELFSKSLNQKNIITKHYFQKQYLSGMTQKFHEKMEIDQSNVN
jgi:hypothetical protein